MEAAIVPPAMSRGSSQNSAATPRPTEEEDVTSITLSKPNGRTYSNGIWTVVVCNIWHVVCGICFLVYAILLSQWEHFKLSWLPCWVLMNKVEVKEPTNRKDPPKNCLFHHNSGSGVTYEYRLRCSFDFCYPIADKYGGPSVSSNFSQKSEVLGQPR